MQFLHRRQSLSARLSMTICTVLVLTNIAVSAGMLACSNRVILSTVQDYSLRMLSLQAGVYEQQAHAQFQTAISLFNNADVQTLRTALTLSLHRQSAAWSRAREVLSAGDGILSVYIINQACDKITSLGKCASFRTFETFFDQEALAMLEDSERYPSGAPITRTVHYGNGLYNTKEEGRDVPVATLIIREKTQNKWSALIVNYTLDPTRAYPFLSGDGYHYSLLGGDGALLYSTDNEQNELNAPVYERVLHLSAERESGVTVKYRSGERVIATWLRAARGRSVFVSIVPYARVSDSVAALLTASALLTAAACIVGLCLVAVLIRRHLAALQAFFRRLGEFLRFPAQDVSLTREDLMHYQESLSADYDYLMHLEKYRARNSRYLSEICVRELLSQSAPRRARAAAEELGVDPSRAAYLAFVRLSCPDDAEAFLRGLFSALPRWHIAETRDDIAGGYTLILQPPCAALPDPTEILETLLGAFPGSDGAASGLAEPAAWPDMAQALHRMQSARFTFSVHALLILGQGDFDESEAERIAERFYLALCEGRCGDALGEIDALVGLLQDAPDCRLALHDMLAALQRADQSIESAQFIDGVSALGTPAEAFAELRRYVGGPLMKCSAARAGNADLATRIERFVAENLRDPNLSSAMIAEAFELSIAYVNRTFYHARSIKLAIYIQDQRLNLARELMLSTDESIDNLLDAVGWDNKKYFYTIFKKSYGVTPNEYRMNRGRIVL